MGRFDDAIRGILKGGAVIFAGQFLELGISFLAKLVVARELDLTDFGGVSLGLTIFALLGTVSLLGVHVGVARFLPRDEGADHTRSVLVSGLSLGMGTTLLTGVGVVVAAPYLASEVFNDPGITPVLQIFGGIIPLFGLNRLTEAATQGNKHPVQKVLIENLSLPITRIAALAIVLSLGATATGVAWAYLSSWFVSGLVCVWYLIRHTELMNREVQFSLRWREMLTFSVPLTIASAMSFILDDIDKLLIGRFSDTSQVAIYDVAYTMADTMTIGLTAMGFMFLPMISEFHSNGESERMKRSYQVVTKWIVMLTLPVFLVMLLFPALSIGIPFGSKYATGASTLSVLALGFFIHVSFGMNHATLVSIGETKLIIYATSATAVFNVIMNLILIPRYGYFGAAVATTLSFVVINSVYSVYLYHNYDIIPLTEAVIRPVVISVVLCGGIYIPMRALVEPTPAVLIVFLVIFVPTYGVAVLRFGGIEEEEVMIVQSVEERFDIKLEPLKRIAKKIM